ncbi:hypothetical protein PY093_00605 [Cytobacillus sp. S13-E01]|uniref:hypothetical protein n=1 Tax=Cytobacillus sp. S13-E01 TaxID=3031326 RepID=UPI0023D7D4AF|nr:hypothetical protein [Cytobacillus sp. S13-E01]MDF0725204.1 hypothetical protein [Cytobacillus sp. S13-E01]
MKVNMIQSMLKSANIGQSHALAFKKGQIFQGRVVKLYKDDIAQIQVGKLKLVAKLQAPLSIDNQYLFQVQPSKEQTELKILDRVKENSSMNMGNSNKPATQIMQKLGLKSTKENLELTQFFLKNNIPFSKENLHHARQWLPVEEGVSKGLIAFKLLLTRGLPFTYNSFKAMVALQDETPLVNHLTKLHDSLEVLQSKSASVNQLLEKLKFIVAKESGVGLSQPWDDGPNTLTAMKQLLTMFGLQYEHDVVTSLSRGERQIQNDTLKPLLLSTLSELGQTPMKDGIEHIINRLTGQQLLSQETGSFQQLILQLPIQLGSILTDLTIQFNGKKQNNGEIDPNYCHIIFNLELEHLKEITVDVKIQNRVMNITIFNDNRRLDLIIASLKPSLVEGLEHINYKLSSLQVVNGTELSLGPKKESIVSRSSFEGFHGVDLRI